MVSLREFMDLRFDGIERELADLKGQIGDMRSAIEKVAVDAVVVERMGNQVGDNEGQIADLGTRVAEIETTTRAIKWVAGVLSAIMLALAIAWLKNLMGL